MKRFLAIAWLGCALPCFAQLDYLLKPTESILIRAPQNPKLDGHISQIQADGFVTLPSVGRVPAGGVGLQAFEKRLSNRLEHGPSTNPVAVSVVAFRSSRPPARP